MNPGRVLGRPGDRYYNVIKQGYEATGFDTGPLEKAVREAAFTQSEKSGFGYDNYFKFS